MGLRYPKTWVLLGIAFLFAGSAMTANAATLRLAPSTGTFATGSTFDVSIFLDTQGQTINALDIILRFSPHQLQVVSPAVGRSIVGVWTASPSFNNATGEIRLQGGIPGGINTSQGLVSTITFRARQIGQAALRFDENSKVLLHDGRGTDVLRNVQGAIYQIALPPPAGPLVVSDTHPDQTKWYSSPNVVLRWEPIAGVTAYSYVLNQDPIDTPDIIAESDRTGVTYRNLADGQHYFHIRALRDGIWGGTTHFAINIDTTPPADFPIEIIPSARTVRRQPMIEWHTTDATSGIERYELAIIPLTPGVDAKATPDRPFFIEAHSPYIAPILELGTYDVIIRSYDRAGNYREVVKRLSIVNTIFEFIGEAGIEFRGRFIMPWSWFWGLGLFMLVGIALLALRLKTRHIRLAAQLRKKDIPEEVRADLSKLKKYREKYGKLMAIFFLIGSSYILHSVFYAESALAQQMEFGPPIITTVSRDISNTEIFYIGGRSETPAAEIQIFLQNLRTGEAKRFSVNADNHGRWFYRHYTFLSPGDYLLWSQSRVGETLSPPGPQVRMTVRQTALEIGMTRISFEMLYLASALLLFVAFIVLAIYSIVHAAHIRRKESLLAKEIKEAQEALRRGFAILRRDIEAELAVVKKARFSKELAEEEKVREQELLADLEKVEAYIGKEIWDIEKAERTG